MVKFSSEDKHIGEPLFPEMKKATLGVKGIKLNPDDFVSNVYLLDVGDNEVVEYKGKKVELRKLKIGKRGTKGVKVRR